MIVLKRAIALLQLPHNTNTTIFHTLSGNVTNSLPTTYLSSVVLETATALLTIAHNTYTTSRRKFTKTHYPPPQRQGWYSNHLRHSQTTPTPTFDVMCEKLSSYHYSARVMIKPATALPPITHNTFSTFVHDPPKT